ncbi:autotransporter domain-containing protein [Mesorhizobium sp. ES1-1]|nr:autotransporter domain-containing protein [Mesorhizobium sp. ES1-1]
MASDVDDRSSSGTSPFEMTKEDVAPNLAAAGRVTTYEGTESAGNAAITNNQDESVEFLDQSTAAQATIINNSGGSALFADQSTAGSAFMTNNAGSSIRFTGQATGGGSNITNNENGTISFDDHAVGGNAAIANNGTILFQDDANGQQVNIVSNGGATIVFSGNATAGTAQIANNGSLDFTGQASAGQSLLTNNETGETTFSGNSTAAIAAITNNGALTFEDEATAGSASIINNQSGLVLFSGSADAGSAFIANSGELDFGGTASAGAAEIANNASGVLALSDFSSLGNASLNNAGLATFSDNATAGAGTIVTGPTGRTIFRDRSSGGTAALETNLGGVVDFSGISDGQIEVGSIQGPGTYYLGGIAVAVGGNNLSTAVDGALLDGGSSGGSGGSLIKTGTGTLTLSGANTYTGATDVRGGVLQAGAAGSFAARSAFTIADGALLDLAGFDQTIGSLAGTGSVDLATATLTAGGDGTDSVFAGEIGGTGGLVKTGAGSMELAGVSSYSGLTEIMQGSLIVSGSIAASPVQVDAGATLGGVGIVGSTTVAGTLARANDGGTLRVNGDLTLGAGSVYSLSLDPDPVPSLVTATGTATIDGSSLIVSTSGGFTLSGTSFRILTAAQVNGNFAAVESEMPFIDLDLTYGSGTVDLDVSRNDTSFGAIAETANQRAVANAVEQLPGGAISDAIVASADAASARGAFDALSGEIYPSLANGLLESDLVLRDILLSRMRDPATQKGATAGSRAWFNPYSTDAAAGSDGNAADSDISRSGFLTGGDVPLNESWLVGVAAGYGQSDFGVDARASSASVDTLSLAAYSAWSGSGFRGKFGGLYSWHDIKSARHVAFGTFEDDVTGAYDASSGEVFGEIDYPIMANRVEIAPFINLTYARWDSEDWSESGGDASLDVQASHMNGLVTTSGMRIAADMSLDRDLLVRFGAMAGWRTSTFDESGQWHQLAGTAPFFIGGVPVERNAAVLGADMRIVFKSISLGLAYDGMMGGDTQHHSYQGFLNVKF